jgi:hypothetical protein
MKIGLFIPCYIDALFPELGIAALEILERLGCLVAYQLDQTCCGQPRANSGCQDDATAPVDNLVGLPPHREPPDSLSAFFAVGSHASVLSNLAPT